MMKRLPMIHTPERGWHVDLPTYRMIPGSIEPVIKKLTTADTVAPDADPKDKRLKDLTVECEIPNEYADPKTGKLSEKHVRKTHRGHELWDHKDKRYTW